MIDWMEPLLRDIAEVTGQLESLSAIEPDPRNRMQHEFLMGWIPRLLDFGKQAEAYDLCESVLATQPDAREPCPEPSWTALRNFCELQMAHMDAVRRNELPRCHEIVTRHITSGLSGEAEHARSLQGVLCLLEGHIDEACADFEEAASDFEKAGEFVYALKARVRQISTIRLRGHYDRADALCHEVLRRSRELGLVAVVPLLCAGSLLGSNAAEQGRLREAFRLLRDAARLANAMPPSVASAFALFQYGNALARTGRLEEAATWLERADEAQRTLDPLGRVATHFKLAQVYRHLGAWNKAIPLIEKALNSRLGGIDPEDFRDFYTEAVEIALGSHDLSRALQLQKDMIHQLALRKDPTAEDLAWPEATGRRIDTWTSSWKSHFAGEAGKASTLVAIDLAESCLLVKKHGEFPLQKSFRRDSGTWGFLQSLASAVACC